MKNRRISAMLLAFVLLFSAALSTSGAWMGSAFAEDGTDEEQVLVFKTWAYQAGLSDYVLAEAFNQTHPGKRIVVEEVLTDEALATELMSGKADYILNSCSTYLDAAKCAASGLFVDLYEWMDADPDFHREDYFENLFEAMEYDEHLYGIVGNLYFPVIFINRAIAEAVGANYEPLDPIDVSEILDLYDAAKEQGLMAEDTPLVFEDAMSKSALALETEFDQYVDLEKKMSHFSEPAFIELLERAKAIYSERRLADGSTMNSDPNGSAFGDAILAQQTSSLIIKTTATMDSVEGGTLAEPHEALMGPLVFESVNGDAIAESAQLLMVPTSCSNPELAWEFIKFCIAPLEEENGEQSDISNKTGGRKYFPVSKTNLATYAECYRTFGNADFDQYLEKLEGRIGEIQEFDIYKLHAYGVTYPILEQYFDYGTITAEECARQMDERLYLYLNE